MQTKSVLNGKEINLTSDNTTIKSTNFNVDKSGKMTCTNANISAKGGSNTGDSSGLNLKVVSDSVNKYSGLCPGFGIVRNGTMNFVNMEATTLNGQDIASMEIRADTNNYISNNSYSSLGMSTTLWHSSSSSTQVSSFGITTPKLTQTSLESQKKNFEKMQDNALNIIDNIDIYKYNLKSEEDTDKKHIGFVIGDKYKYSKEVTANDNTGVDIYSFVSLCCKAIQEQQTQIEMLRNEIKEMEANNE